MYDLARATGGRYHAYSEGGIDADDQPEPFEVNTLDRSH